MKICYLRFNFVIFFVLVHSNVTISRVLLQVGMYLWRNQTCRNIQGIRFNCKSEIDGTERITALVTSTVSNLSPSNVSFSHLSGFCGATYLDFLLLFHPLFLSIYSYLAHTPHQRLRPFVLTSVPYIVYVQSNFLRNQEPRLISTKNF